MEHVVRVALPTSILTVEPPGLPRFLKAYQILRFSSIFGVGEVVFFREFSTPEKSHRKAVDLLDKVWRYYETPPYLRKKLVPLDEDLRWVGLLPPLRLEAFEVSRNIYKGQVRLGYIAKAKNGLCEADIGVGEKYVVRGECIEGVQPVRVLDPKEKIVEVASSTLYNGPRLEVKQSLREVIEAYVGRAFILATDRKGRVPRLDSGLVSRLGEDIIVLFGGPKHGLFEIAVAEGFSLQSMVDDVWNTIPGQKVATVRTEEALIITLGLINLVRSMFPEMGSSL
ncbi:putative RNA uridine N3 methyltransferase [Thermogladius sp. 4427co]|uniref:putative RNA uridine N3 methyltransferase n=1 Tax=Thermogladius sp. 4427co TaxID=3450718 RepID=UPI003F7A599A